MLSFYSNSETNHQFVFKTLLKVPFPDFSHLVSVGFLFCLFFPSTQAESAIYGAVEGTFLGLYDMMSI